MAFVNVTSATNDGSSTTIAAAAIEHKAGRLLVAYIAGGSDANFVNQVTDTAGNTWVQVPSARATSVAAGHCDIWYAKNCLGNTANVVTATYAAANSFRRILVAQYDDMDKFTLADAAATGAGGPGTTATSGSFTTARKRELIVTGAVGDATTTWSAAVGSALNLRESIAASDASLADKAVSDIQSAVTLSMTSSASVNWLISVATFVEAPDQNPVRVRPRLPYDEDGFDVGMMAGTSLAGIIDEDWIFATDPGAMSGVASLTFSNAATLVGSGALAGVAAQAFINPATLTGLGALVGVASQSFANSGTLVGSGTLSGVVLLTFTNQATLTGDGGAPAVAAPWLTRGRRRGRR